MTNNIYFGNSVNDTVSVNINNAIDNLKLTPRSTTPASGEVTVINCPAVQAPVGPNPDKGVFGTSGAGNKIQIQFSYLESGPQTYTVTVEGMSGSDLYFYVFDGSLVGQDATGRPNGITITPVK